MRWPRIWVKRRPPSDRDAATPGATWMLLVLYRANGDEHAARLPLTDDTVAARVERLLEAVRLGQRKATLDLYACLHNEWGRTSLVGAPGVGRRLSVPGPTGRPGPGGDVAPP